MPEEHGLFSVIYSMTKPNNQLAAMNAEE